jgi:hypothetical protein
MAVECVNRRERVSQRGWRTKDRRLIALATLPEWRSIREGPEVEHDLAAD